MADPYKIVRFLKDYMKITGVDGQSYGPFMKGQTVSLPSENADQLIKWEVAEDTRKEVKEPSLKEVFKGEVLSGYVAAARGRTLNEFKEKSKEEIEALRREVLGEIDEELAAIEKLKKQVKEIV